MVELEFSGLCKGCKVADLELESIDLSDDFSNIFSKNITWEVRCTHKDACERIKRQFIPSDPHKRFALDLGAMK